MRTPWAGQILTDWCSAEGLAGWLPLLVAMTWAVFLLLGWPRLSTRRRLTWALPSAVVILLSLEMACIPALVPHRTDFSAQTDPVKIWRLPPNSSELETNAQGLRNAHDVVPKSGPRILCLGDSWVFGHGVSREEAWPAQLGAKTGLEVLNAGVMGYCLYQAWLTLQDPGLALKPDLVILNNVHNHAQNSAFLLSEGPLPEALRPWLHKSHLYLWLTRGVQRWRLRWHLFSGQENLGVPDHAALEAISRRILQTCRAHDIDVILLSDLRTPQELHAPPTHEVLGREMGIPVVRVNLTDPRRRALKAPHHPDAEGHRQVAEALAPVVRSRLEARRHRASSRQEPH